MKKKPDSNGGFLITQIKQLQDRVFDKMLLEQNIVLSSGQGRILFVLWNNDNQTVTEISNATSIAKNTASIVIDGMVSKGLLKRKPDPENRRKTIVYLTEYAKTLKKKYESVSKQMTELFYKDFSEKEKSETEKYLSRLLQNLKDAEKI